MPLDSFLGDFFEWPWQNILAFAAFVVLCATQIPRLRPVAQHVIQNVIGVNEAISGAVQSALEHFDAKVEERIEMRHEETKQHLNEIERKINHYHAHSEHDEEGDT